MGIAAIGLRGCALAPFVLGLLMPRSSFIIPLPDLCTCVGVLGAEAGPPPWPCASLRRRRSVGTRPPCEDDSVDCRRLEECECELGARAVVLLLVVPLLVADIGGAICIGEKGGGMEGCCWLVVVVPVADDDTAEMGGGGGGMVDG